MAPSSMVTWSITTELTILHCDPILQWFPNRKFFFSFFKKTKQFHIIVIVTNHRFFNGTFLSNTTAKPHNTIRTDLKKKKHFLIFVKIVKKTILIVTWVLGSISAPASTKLFLVNGINGENPEGLRWLATFFSKTKLVWIINNKKQKNKHHCLRKRSYPMCWHDDNRSNHLKRAQNISKHRHQD